MDNDGKSRGAKAIPERESTNQESGHYGEHHKLLHACAVDNIIKPLLDAMETVVYVDDKQVRKVISEKVDLTKMPSIQDPSPLLATSLEKYTEVLHIIVTWNVED